MASPGEGYDKQWLQELPDDLKCVICLCVARDPRQHGDGGCGRVFCASCLTRYGQTNCPFCRTRLRTFSDVRGLHQINALKLRCDNHHKGCQWTGELGDLQTHLLTSDCTKMTYAFSCNLLTQISSNYKFTSPAFYSSPKGYKICIRINFEKIVQANEGKEHVLLHVHLMKGDNDNSLPWPFTGTVSVKLLDQLKDRNHHSRTVRFGAQDVASQRVVTGRDRAMKGKGGTFLSSEALHAQFDGQYIYIEEQTLLFRVRVIE